jgi:hypothetical protein
MNAMRTGSRTRPALIVGALVALLLASAAVAVAAAPEKRPSLASTSQYKAFTEFVKTLDGLVGQPQTTAQKNTFQAELTTKKEAVAHKANALFNRGAEEAEAESNEKFKEQQKAIRAKQGEELEAVDAEWATKNERAISSYKGKLERMENGHNNYQAKTNEQIQSLRAEKAAEPDVNKKAKIQERIAKKIESVARSRADEKSRRDSLKEGFKRQRSELAAGQKKKEGEITEFADARVEKSSNHWKRVFAGKKEKLNAKRESQLAYINSKLEKGRADIASMPASG